MDDELLSLVLGPDKEVVSYTGLDINGYRFHAEDHDSRLTTQNSGIVVKVEASNGPFSYYGVLEEILELKYMGGRLVHFQVCMVGHA